MSHGGQVRSALRIEKKKQGADKREQRRVSRIKKPYYATLFGFSAFWIHAEKAARKETKGKTVMEGKCSVKARNDTCWRRYFGSTQRKGPPLAMVLPDLTFKENNFEKITT